MEDYCEIDNVDDTLNLQKNDVLLVMFYASWCVHCPKDAWEYLYNNHNNSKLDNNRTMIIKKINESNSIFKDFCLEIDYPVTSFPTILKITKVNTFDLVVEVFNDHRTPIHFKRFANKLN